MMWNMERDWARLGAAIVAAYETLGLRHSDFAQLAGVSRSTLYRLEKGDGAAPSANTLAKIDRALGWPHGTAEAITEGAEAPAPSDPREITFAKPESLSEPSVLDQLPTQIAAGLTGPGEVVGVDVVDIGPDGSGARVYVVMTRDADASDADPEVVKATLAEWQRKRRELWRQTDAPPS